MKYISNVKSCGCGRSNDHEHKTMEHYCLHEKNKQGEIVSEMFMHGYDGEDDNVTEFIKEADRESGNRTNYFITKVSEI